MVQAAKAEATRAALGPTLVKLVEAGLDIVCVDADLGVSTSAVKFGQAFPERFFAVGVAEQNMVGVAAGLATRREDRVLQHVRRVRARPLL